MGNPAEETYRYPNQIQHYGKTPVGFVNTAEPHAGRRVKQLWPALDGAAAQASAEPRAAGQNPLLHPLGTSFFAAERH